MKDFFISYNGKDKSWAEWIAYQLEEVGYTTVIQAWDFHPGGNFVLEMQKATVGTERTLLVLSQHYLDAEYTQPEWAAAFVKDPKGIDRKLVPVRVAECSPEGLLAPITYIDLVGKGEQTAVETLLAGVKDERPKPKSSPPFPGQSTSGLTAGRPKPEFPGSLTVRSNLPSTRKNLRSLTESQSRSRATWVLGSLLLVFSVWVFIFAPDTLPEYKHRMLDIFLALLSGLFAFFLTGDIGLEIKSIKSRFGSLGVKATGGIAVFVLVLWWWSGSLAPVGVEKKLGEIKRSTEKIVELLQQELSIKNDQIVFLQGQLERLQTQVPSPRARELAAQIPTDADPYALALKAIAESRFDDARRLLEKAASNKEVELVKIYAVRGQTEIFAGRYADAVGWYQKALALGPGDPNILNETAVAFIYAGQYPAAEPLLRRALAIWEKALGPEHPDVATSLNNLAALYHAQGQYRAAEPLYQQALAISEEALGPEHPDVAQSLNNLAALYRAQGQYRAAEPLYQRALAILEKALGPEHPDVATSLNNLAELYHAQGQYTKAELLYQRALAIREKALEPEHPDVAQSLNNLAALYHAQGQYTKAAPLCQRALVILEKALGPDHPDVATTLNNLAGLYDAEGQYTKAEPLYQRALAVREKTLGPEHPDVATSLNNLAAFYRAQNQYTKAEPLYQRALAVREKALGPEHPDVAQSLNNLAGLYDAQGQYAEAEPLYQQALAIIEKALGVEHPNVAASLNNLADLYCAQEKYAEAELFYQRALAVREKVLGPEHPDVAQSLNNLAELYRAQGQYTKAAPLYQRALAIWEKALGSEHPRVATVLENYALLLWETNQKAKAAELMTRAQAIRAKHAEENPAKRDV